MKVLFYLHHPSQYHMFKHVIKKMLSLNHEVVVFAVTKDILTNLLDSEGIDYINNCVNRRKNNKISMFATLVKQDWRLLKYCLKRKPDIMLGTSLEICHVGKLLSIPAFMFCEDDIDIVPLMSKLSYPFAHGIISPIVCSVGKWGKKKIGYSGYQKLAYLHPKYFQPDINIVKKYIDIGKKYCIIRLVKLDAHHDKGIDGINANYLKQIINKLSDWGNVYITSEDELPTEFKRYKLSIEYKDIHHILFFASLYIGDSQSMAVEAALLGIPNLRFNDFAGRISVLEELEKKYELTFAYKTNDFSLLVNKIDELINTDNLKEIWNQRRSFMLSEKIDLTAFLEWFIVSFPKSKEICKNKYNNKIYKFDL